MPSGLKRFQRAESLHFITFSCFHRLPLLEAPGGRWPGHQFPLPVSSEHNPGCAPFIAYFAMSGRELFAYGCFSNLLLRSGGEGEMWATR